MKKTIIITLLSAVVGVGLAVYMSLGGSITVMKTYELKELTCSLNLQSCQKTYKDFNVTFDIYPKPIRFMQKSDFKIIGLNQKLQNPRLEIYGLNMDMGIIKANLINKDGVYQSPIVLSSCLMDTMRYRAQLYDGDKKLPLYIDFDLKR